MKSKMYDGRRIQLAMLRKTLPESSFRSCRDINYVSIPIYVLNLCPMRTMADANNI